MSIHLNDTETVLIETDADAEFDRRDRISLRSEPNALDVAGKSVLRGGRIRWRLRPKQGIPIGTTGQIIATLVKPDGVSFTDQTKFEVLPAEEERSKKAKGYVPPFEIFPIDPNNENWTVVWPNLGDEVDQVKQLSVAFKPIESGKGIYVYYSTVFTPFRDQIERLKVENPALVQTFTTNYEIWVGYHAILQYYNQSNKTGEIDDDTLDQLREDERARVARMQVKEAMHITELTQRALQAQSAD